MPPCASVPATEEACRLVRMERRPLAFEFMASGPPCGNGAASAVRMARTPRLWRRWHGESALMLALVASGPIRRAEYYRIDKRLDRARSRQAAMGWNLHEERIHDASRGMGTSANMSLPKPGGMQSFFCTLHESQKIRGIRFLSQRIPAATVHFQGDFSRVPASNRPDNRGNISRN